MCVCRPFLCGWGRREANRITLLSHNCTRRLGADTAAMRGRMCRKQRLTSCPHDSTPCSGDVYRSHAPGRGADLAHPDLPCSAALDADVHRARGHGAARAVAPVEHHIVGWRGAAETREAGAPKPRGPWQHWLAPPVACNAPGPLRHRAALSAAQRSAASLPGAPSTTGTGRELLRTNRNASFAGQAQGRISEGQA